MRPSAAGKFLLAARGARWENWGSHGKNGYFRVELLMEATLNICSNIIYEFLSSLEPTRVCEESPSRRGFSAQLPSPSNQVIG